MNWRCLFGHDIEWLPSPPGIMHGYGAPVRCRRAGCGYSHPGFPYPSDALHRVYDDLANLASVPSLDDRLKAAGVGPCPDCGFITGHDVECINR